jgi:tetratricopeptide (TPR) repeat protein
VGVLGLLWFGATVASTLPLVPARDVMAADRYVYLPNVGLHWIWAALLVHAVAWAVRRWDRQVLAWLAGGVGIAAAVGILVYTWHVESFYKSNLAKASRIAEVYPDEPGVWEDIGWAHYRSGDYLEAINAARGDLDKHPQEMACEVYQLIGMAQVRIGRVEEGIATLHQAVEANPDYGKCYSRLGQVYYELERYDDAERNYVRAIEIMPDYLPAVQVLGHVYRKMGRRGDAERLYRRALEINRFDPVATTALAGIEVERGDCAPAIARFERLLSWMPQNTVARTNLGVCYAKTGRQAEARVAYGEALRRDPSAVTAALNLALLEADAGNASAAVALLERVVGRNPVDRQVLTAGYDLLTDLDRPQDAARLWTDALSHEPEAPDLLAWHAWSSALAAQWAPAQEAAQAALTYAEIARGTSTAAKEPGSGVEGTGAAFPSLALAALLLADLAANDPDAADRQLDRLLDSPSNPTDARNRLRSAIAEMAEQTPDDQWPYYFAARLLLAEGQTGAARMGFEEFIRRSPDQTWRRRAAKLLPASD